MFSEISGDLVQLAKLNKIEAMMHGCNCFHAMASGIAGQIAKEFPGAVNIDKRTTKGSYNKLGTLSIYKPVNSPYIINAYTQYRPGPDARLIDIISCLDKAIYFCKDKITYLGIPLLGCGIGGLDENIVVPEIKKLADKTNLMVTLVRYDPN